MNIHATGTVNYKTWDEKTWDGKQWDEVLGPKLTRASVTNTFHGDIEGEGTLEYLMAYRDDHFASFVGMERIVGRVGDRAGSFVLEHNGTFEDGAVQGTWSVVPDSGTDDLRGLFGEGAYTWSGQHDQSTSFTLDYDFEAMEVVGRKSDAPDEARVNL